MWRCRRTKVTSHKRSAVRQGIEVLSRCPASEEKTWGGVTSLAMQLIWGERTVVKSNRLAGSEKGNSLEILYVGLTDNRPTGGKGKGSQRQAIGKDSDESGGVYLQRGIFSGPVRRGRGGGKKGSMEGGEGKDREGGEGREEREENGDGTFSNNTALNSQRREGFEHSAGGPQKGEETRGKMLKWRAPEPVGIASAHP